MQWFGLASRPERSAMLVGYTQTRPNFGLQLSITGAAHSVLRPLCLLAALAAEASVMPLDTFQNSSAPLALLHHFWN